MREGCPSPDQALDAFLDDLLIAGRSPATIGTYRSLLKPVRNLSALSPPVCRELVADAIRTKSRATAHTLWAALGSFGKWHVQHGYMIKSPMADIPSPHVPEKPHRFLTRDEVQRLWHACRNDQERLIIRLLLTGLRANELLSCQRSGDVLTVIGKGSKPRRVPIDQETVRLFAAGLPANYTRLFVKLSRLGKRAKVPHVHPHLLRHTWASQSLLAGLDSQSLMQLGGWSNAEMIKRYTKSAREEAAMNAARSLGLTGKLLDG